VHRLANDFCPAARTSNPLISRLSRGYLPECLFAHVATRLHRNTSRGRATYSSQEGFIYYMFGARRVPLLGKLGFVRLIIASGVLIREIKTEKVETGDKPRFYRPICLA